jgi:uncharacterized protein Smg (DUF494 family)
VVSWLGDRFQQTIQHNSRGSEIRIDHREVTDQLAFQEQGVLKHLERLQIIVSEELFQRLLIRGATGFRFPNARKRDYVR